MKKDINIFLIAKSQPNQNELSQWLDNLNINNKEELINELDSVTQTIGLAAKRCYMSFEEGHNPNITKVRKNWVDYFNNILSSGHGSVLEHSSYSFAIEGITRVFTSEMNRHRAGWSISEGSLRYIRYDKSIPYWEPNSIQDNINDSERLREQKLQTRIILEQAFQQQYDLYKKLEQIWDINNIINFSDKKKLTSLFRRIIGMGSSTGGVWTGNIRAIRHVLEIRCSEHAEEEICFVFTNICKKLIEIEPLLFGDFQIVDGYYQPIYSKV